MNFSLTLLLALALTLLLALALTQLLALAPTLTWKRFSKRRCSGMKLGGP